MKINCVIVDDEPFARKGLAEYISEIDFLDLKGQAENALVANNLLGQHKIDLMFLDIQMPKITGIELVKTLSHKPMVIFTTAYSEYAVQSYELDVLDYLVKPVSFDRFLKACNKAKEFFMLKSSNTAEQLSTGEYFFVKCDNGYEKVLYDDLLYAEAMENYVALHTTTKKLISYLTFKSVEDYLPAQKFMKVHKSFMVAIDKIQGLSGNEIKIGKTTIPISRSLKDQVVNTLFNNKLLKR